MKKFLIAGAALATMIGTPAFAADMALKAAPPPPTPVCVWCGFYIGVNAGGSWDSNDPAIYIQAGGTASSNLNTSSFAGGGQIG